MAYINTWCHIPGASDTLITRLSQVVRPFYIFRGLILQATPSYARVQGSALLERFFKRDTLSWAYFSLLIPHAMLSLSERSLHFGRVHAVNLKGFDVFLVAISLYLVFRVASSRRQNTSRALPPKPLPLLGNLGAFPKGAEGPHFGRHKALYGVSYCLHQCDKFCELFAGPISSVRALGTTLIILNDKKCVFDLLERRSSIYSGRPVFHFGGRM